MPQPRRLVLTPLTLDQANEYVERHHRHSKPVRGHKFSIGAGVGEDLVGVAIVGRPINRVLDDGWTAEVLRNCTDGTRNACSFLYAACWRAARAMGYRKLVTYIKADEDGASARAAGFRIVGEVQGREWHCPSRPRDPSDPQDRLRLEVAA